MKKIPLNKVGRVGKANIEARKRIAEIAEEKGLNYCEIGLEGCTRSWPLAPAHKHLRSWYRGDVDMLSDYNQWVSACQTCHAQLERDIVLTLQVFNRLRPITKLKTSVNPTQ